MINLDTCLFYLFLRFPFIELSSNSIEQPLFQLNWQRVKLVPVNKEDIKNVINQIKWCGNLTNKQKWYYKKYGFKTEIYRLKVVKFIERMTKGILCEWWNISTRVPMWSTFSGPQWSPVITTILNKRPFWIIEHPKITNSIFLPFHFSSVLFHFLF